MKQFILLLTLTFVLPAKVYCQSEIIKVWPGTPPDEIGSFGEEYDQTKPESNLVAGKRVARITNVTSPELHYYPAPEDKANGTSVVIFPGGGYYVLAWDLEGTEVAEWFNSIGVSAYILKYRVPRRDPDKPWFQPLQDAQRAISIVRSRAKKSNKYNPERIGVLGFSAGGNLAFHSACNKDGRIYSQLDDKDKQSHLPNFAILVYPAYIQNEETGKMMNHFSITKSTPPMFFVHASDDSVSALNSVLGYSELRKNGVHAGLHIYPSGGHGYGLRKSSNPVTLWPERCTEWMENAGLLTRKVSYIESYAKELYSKFMGGEALPILDKETYQPNMKDTYAIQNAFVNHFIENKDQEIGGFKGAVGAKRAQDSLGLDGPVSAVLYKSGYVKADGLPKLSLKEEGSMMVENEIGFVFSSDVSERIDNVHRLKKVIKAIVPVIELPGGRSPKGGGGIKDNITRNFGSYKYIVAKGLPVDEVNPDEIEIVLKKDGEIINSPKGSDAYNGQWANLIHQLNHAVGQGYTIKAGQIIITGALGKIQPVSPGSYSADYGELGTIEFRITE